MFLTERQLRLLLNSILNESAGELTQSSENFEVTADGSNYKVSGPGVTNLIS